MIIAGRPAMGKTSFALSIAKNVAVDYDGIPYRMATMQPLALMAWYQKLPKDLSNGHISSLKTSALSALSDLHKSDVCAVSGKAAAR